MPAFIALFRGINMAGHKKVAMSDLIALARTLGLRNARTLLNSGNLIFSSGEHTAAALEALLEREIAAKLGLSVCVMVRTAVEWRKIVEANPFAGIDGGPKAQAAVMFLKKTPSAANAAALKKVAADRLKMDGREIYVFFPNGFDDPASALPPIAKTLHTPVTGRNWKTVVKLAQAVAPSASLARARSAPPA